MTQLTTKAIPIISTTRKYSNSQLRNPKRKLNVVNLLLVFLFSVLTGPSWAQNLPVIAVTEIRASVDSSSYRDFKNSKATNFQSMLETQLVKIGRFKIVERERIDQVLSEQALQGEFSGVGTKLSVGAVDYVVFGTITKFGTNQRTVSTGEFSTRRLVTEFGLDLKVVSALDGEVRRAENVDVRIESGASIRTGDFATSEGLADPLADVQRRAAKKVAAAIAESIFPIEVLAFRQDTYSACCVYLNYGEAVLTVGDRLKIVEKVEALRDETTGLDLGSIEKTIGEIEITEVLEMFSKGRILSGETPTKGQLARILRDVIDLKTSGSNQQRKRLGREL